MSFLSTTYTAPSGSFILQKPEALDAIPTGDYRPVYNPSILEHYSPSFEVTKTFQYEGDEWFEGLSKFTCRIASSDLDIYAEKLVALTEHVQSKNPHCLLAPLRGAAKPCATVEVMSRGNVMYDYFNFQAGSSTKNQQRITNDLTAILKQRDPSSSEFRINVTDTARGGQGINTLASLLRDIREGHAQFKKQKWILDINLFHDSSSNTNIKNIEAVQQRFSELGKFELQVNRYPVSSLIVEDFDPALAVKIESDGRVFRFKPCAEAGRFLLRIGNVVGVVESENCYQTFEKLYSDSITEYLVTSPKHEQDGVVWREYQEK